MSGGQDRDVIIVGAGPVGLISALDLSYRGIPVLVLERRTDVDPMHSRCNTTSARSMELLRRYGCNMPYREAGLPPDYPTDVLYMTRINGIEITRFKLAGSGARFEEDRFSFDANWNSVERPHRSSQMFLERVLRAHALEQPNIEIRYFHEVTSVNQSNRGVTLGYRDTRDDSTGTLSARYVMACDGGKSTVRRQLGIKMEGGATGSGRTQSIFFRSRDVLANFNAPPGWMNWVINSDNFGNIISINGDDLWLTHCMIPEGAEGVSEEQYDRQIRETMGCDIDYEVLSVETWQFNRVLATKFREGNVFLAGDAAHSWPPYAGHGMNTGIEDGVGLTWMLAGVLRGWAPESILDAYEAERLPIDDLVSHTASGMARAQHKVTQDMDMRARIEDPGPEGAAIRKKVRAELLEIDSRQFNAEGMNFGWHYEDSPLIIYDGEEAPPYEVSRYTPSTVPGCRAPHFTFIETGEPLLDRMGAGFTLLVNDDDVDISGLTGAAKKCDLPLDIVDIAHEPRARPHYEHKLILVRPDDRIAWRSNAAPDNPAHVIDRVRGAAA
ncbi:MAG: FAD-dependent monooxygenase [Alphaproteobacteria bacterium]